MNFNLTIHHGDEALTLVRDSAFVARWQMLAVLDNKFTLIQEPPFVRTWYLHMDRFEPHLFVGRDTSGQIVGLMPLARNRDNGTLTHAGDIHAEYHGWIAIPELDEPFAEECLIAVKHLGIDQWAWGWLPPGSPVGFLRSRRLRESGIFSTHRTEESPVWELNDNERLERLLRTKSIKIKMNRYKKLGLLRLERVHDKDRTRQLLRDCRLQTDFRQEAINGVRPFADNPLKEPLYVERQDFPEANHFTVLWSNDRPLSFHFGECNADTLVLGLMAYDPTEGRNSPGKLHLIELARLLKEEGLNRIDLTPGGDQYKEDFANASQTLVRPTFYFSRTGKLWADARLASRRHLKDALAKAHVSPQRFRDVVRLAKGSFSHITKRPIRHSINLAKRLVQENIVSLQYHRHLEPTTPLHSRDPDVHVQRYEDLMLYCGSSPEDRAELLRTALKRFTQRQTVYTIERNGVLACYGWISPGGGPHHFEDVGVTTDIPSDSAMLYDLFTHPAYQGNGMCLRAIQQMLRDLADVGATTAFATVLRGNESSIRAIEEAGFRLFKIFRRRRILWREVKSEEMVREVPG